MTKSSLFFTVSTFCLLSAIWATSVSARLTASPEKFVVGQRVTLTGTNMVSPLSGTESCTGPDAKRMDDCQYVTEVLFRRNGYDYKKGTIVPSASNDSQLVFVVPDMPSGTYGVEIWHNYTNKGFRSSGGDAVIWKLEVVNPNPASPKPSPQSTPKPSPVVSNSPQSSLAPTPAPTLSPSPTSSLEPSPTLVPSPVPASSEPVQTPSNPVVRAWQNVSESLKKWWQRWF